MSISALRQIITDAGGTPGANEHGYTHIGLTRELIRALGETPTQFTRVGTLRELVTAAGGTPTQWTVTGLMRELVTALGGTATSYSNDALWDQVETLGFGPSLGPELAPNPTFDNSTNVTIVGAPAISGGQLNMGTVSGDLAQESLPATTAGNQYRLVPDVATLGTTATRVFIGSDAGGVVEHGNVALTAGENVIDFTTATTRTNMLIRFVNAANGTATVINGFSVKKFL